MRTEYEGTIITVRDLEDAIRATRRYTKGAFHKAPDHPIQGSEFPSRFVTEFYEVYPSLDIGWDMAASDAWAWVWGDVSHIEVLFQYDYRNNKARMIVRGGRAVVEELVKGIPNFEERIAKVMYEKEAIMGVSDRIWISSVPDTQQVAD